MQRNDRAKLWMGVLLLAVMLPVLAGAGAVSGIQARISEILARVQVLKGQLQAALLSAPSSGGGVPVVAGTPQHIFGQLVIDATGLAEDVKTSAVTLALTAPDDESQRGLRSCQLLDGAKALNTGANAVNPIASRDDTIYPIFTLNVELIVPQGATKTLDLQCDVLARPGSRASYKWSLGLSPARFTGTRTGLEFAPKLSMTGNEMRRVAYAGSLSIELDSTTPAARTVAGGSHDVISGVLKISAAKEPVELQTLALQIDGPNRYAVTGYALWDGDKKVADSVLDGRNAVFMAQLNPVVTIPVDGSKLLTVKLDLSPSGYAARAQMGDMVALNYNGSDGNNYLTRGRGVYSGQGVVSSTEVDTVSPYITIGEGDGSVGGSGGASNVLVYEKLPAPTSELLNGLVALYRFAARAPSGAALALPAFVFTIENQGVVVKDLKLYAYTASDFFTKAYTVNPIARQNGSMEGTTIITLVPENAGLPVGTPAGTTYYFELRGTTSGRNAEGYIKTALQGLAAETIK